MRFTGSHDLNLDFDGINSFFHPSFHAELSCLLGETCLRTPNVIVVSSGLHDVDTSPELYQESAQRLMQKLKKTNATIVWKGNILNSQYEKKGHIVPIAFFDAIAENVTLSAGGLFYNTSYVMAQVLAKFPIRKFTPDSVHIGAIAFYYNESFHHGLSSCVTQGLINVICGA